MIDPDTPSSLLPLDKEEIPNNVNIPNCSKDEFDCDATRERVWRRIDVFILPVITVFQLLALLDLGNIANARIAGLQEDLMLSNHQFTIVLTTSALSILLGEIPASLLLRVIGPRIMLPTMLTLWGLVVTLQRFVTQYSELLACRFLQGLCDGGSVATIILYLSFWYPRRQLQWRLSLVGVIASLAGAFSGLLAYAIIRMDGLGQRPGWAWIFILEGLLSIVFGLLMFFILPHSPARAFFLNNDEKHYVISRLRESGAIARNDETDAFNWREVGNAFTLPHVWLTNNTITTGTIQIGLGYFTPSIVASLGYTRVQAQLFSVPPAVAGFFVTLITAYLSDRFGARGLNIMFSSTLMIIGLAIFLVSQSLRVKYGSLFLLVSGSRSVSPAISAWNANNVTPYIRRATSVAITSVMVGAGGILATWLFVSLSKNVIITLLVFSVFAWIISGINIAYLRTQNKRKSGIRTTTAPENEPPGLGDRSAWFIYSL
ncbi:hypothetical protein H2248_010290 [Termitomyces sp. 'cryptogamus']|nr:hypothetical protein H2248_010290 [Termitomyces sp. 'cryptogamus']